MNLTNERAVGLEQKEELEVKLVKPLTKLQLLEDTNDKKKLRFIRSGDHKQSQSQIVVSTCKGIQTCDNKTD